MKNIENRNKIKATEQEERIEPDERPEKPTARPQASSLKLGDDKQVSRDLTKLYEQDLKF